MESALVASTGSILIEESVEAIESTEGRGDWKYIIKKVANCEFCEMIIFENVNVVK